MTNEVERRFGQLLLEARGLADHLERLATHSVSPPPASLGEAPVAPLKIVVALEPWAATQYRAGIALLTDSLTASAADVLLRSLLELFAHVFWIHEGRTPDERECRATCFALGLVRASRDFLAGRTSKDVGADTHLRELQHLDREIERQRQRRKCSCKARKYTDVGPTLKQASRRPDLPWAHDTWAWTSTVAHQILPVLSDPAQGLAGTPSASFLERSILLSHFLHVFVNYGIILLELERPENVLVWKQFADAVVASKSFREAAAGRYD